MQDYTRKTSYIEGSDEDCQLEKLNIKEGLVYGLRLWEADTDFFP